MGQTLYRIWQKIARATPDKTALRVFPDDTSVTFADLVGKVESNLTSIPGISRWRHRIVAITTNNPVRWLEAFLTCQAVGAIALPMDADVPEATVRSLLETLRGCAVIGDDEVWETGNGTVRKPACLIKLTSGSTGAPRPLFFEDAQMIADGKNIIATMGITPTDTNLAVIPFGHSYGLGNLIMPLILNGISIAVSRDRFPHSIADAIARSRATICPTVPALYHAVCQSEIPPEKLASLRTWISAGSPLSPGTARAFFEKYGSMIHNFYGSSETGGIAYDREGTDTLTGQSVGKPLHGVTVTQYTSERLQIASEAVFQRNNRRRSGQLGAYLSPDVASLLPDGRIALHGRGSRTIKMGGKRLNLSEVERHLRQVEGVREAFVVSYDDSRGRTRLAAAVVSDASVDTIRTALHTVLPAWKIPVKWTRQEAFPLTARGKVDRAHLTTAMTASPRHPERP